MTTPDLLPCPFCGSEARVWDYPTRGYEVECVKQDCPVEPHIWNETQEGAAKAWNTRATPAPEVAALDAEEQFMSAVWDALKADANDLRKQQRILTAFRAALRGNAATPAPEVAALVEALERIESITVHSGGEIHGVTALHWQTAFEAARDEADIALAALRGIGGAE